MILHKFQLILLAICLVWFSCKTVENEYTVNVTMPGFPSAKLYLTNENGKIVASVDIPPMATDYSGTVVIKGKHFQEEYDLHLVTNEGVLDNIYSHLGVKSGELTAFYPKPYEFAVPEGTAKIIKLSGIADFEEIRFGSSSNGVYSGPADKPAGVLYGGWRYSPVRDELAFLKLNDTAEARYLYLKAQDYATADTIFLNAGDFKVPGQFRDISVEANFGAIESAYIDAISPDFSAYSRLIHVASSFPFFNSSISFYNPAELPADWLLAVNVTTVNGSSAKLFAPGETLIFEKPDISIEKVSIINHESIRIETLGDIDQVSITGFYNLNQLIWTICGSASRLKADVRIPDLSEAVSQLPNDLSEVFSRASITAIQSDAYNESEVQAGLPWLSSQPLNLARSGHKEVWGVY